MNKKETTEKAAKIADLCDVCIAKLDCKCGQCELKERYISAMEMAKWKDEETEKKLQSICEKHCLPNLHEAGKACAYLSIEGKHCWDLESEGSEEARKEGGVCDACEASESKMMSEAYKCIHGYLHYEYSARGKSGERVLEDIKRYCVEQANKLRKARPSTGSGTKKK